MLRTRTRSLITLSITSLVALTMFLAITPAAHAQHPALDPVREEVDPTLSEVFKIVNEKVWHPVHENSTGVIQEHGPEMFECHTVPTIIFVWGIQACFGTNWEHCSVYVKLMYGICY